MKPLRGPGTLDLILCGTQDLIRDVNVTELNNDCAAICFTMHIEGRESHKSDTKTPDFQRADFLKEESS